jgi:type IV pilus assembly protein PilN
MARINLLPWREERRQLRKREFFTQMGVAAAGAVAAVIGGIMFMNSQIELQNERNQYLKAQIADLDRKIVTIQDLEKRKAVLLKKKEIIETLQGDRSLMLNLFIQLAKTIPEGVKLGGIKQAADTISLSGIAQSEARVAQYSRSMEASNFLKDADIVQVRSSDLAPTLRGSKEIANNDPGYRKAFELKIGVDRPKDLSLIEEDKAPETLAPEASAEAPASSAVTPATPIPAAAPAAASAVNNDKAPQASGGTPK